MRRLVERMTRRLDSGTFSTGFYVRFFESSEERQMSRRLICQHKRKEKSTALQSFQRPWYAVRILRCLASNKRFLAIELLLLNSLIQYRYQIICSCSGCNNITPNVLAPPRSSRSLSHTLLCLVLPPTVRKRWKRRQRRKGRQSPNLEKGTAVPFFQGRSSVPSRSCAPFPQAIGTPGTPCRSHGRSLHIRHSRVFDRRSPRVGGQCLQGSQSQAYHASSLAACHSW